ncbi:Sulfotransferase domain-containing protein [Cynara cardunculus var. scolymus]|uniref:Sulfotransferase n=1 Tax=Cynara cardunculus var. scolymus TaxID=59895 RepID=A0A124SFA6_CYNCS|nr:Sulfotransferase domain-containing protein [Cynara cardunculus var. scolymus]
MAELLCSFNKDSLTIKPLKKSSLVLRLMLSAIAMVCGIYICSICLKQMNLQNKSKFLLFEDFKRPCYDTIIDRSQIPYLHYPKPKTFNRSECAGNPVRLFAIVSMQRSGSGWFETFLNSHLNISSNGEIFGPKFRRNNVSSVIQTLDRVYNLDWFTSSSKNECSAAIGFKWMLNQGLMQYPKEIEQYFNDRGVNVIFLLRRNVLRRLVSMLANSFDKDAKLLNGADLLSKYKPELNITSLKSDLRGMESTAEKALNYFNSTRHIIIYYEDLMKDPSQKLIEVEDFLKLPRMNLTSQQVKIHKGSLSEHIKNWEEVNKTLTGTTYEKFLQADY